MHRTEATTETTNNIDHVVAWTKMRPDSTTMTFLRTAELSRVTLSNHLWTEVTEHPVQPAHHATLRAPLTEKRSSRRKCSGLCSPALVSYSAASLSALLTKPQYSWCMPKCRSKIGKTLIKIWASLQRSPRAPCASAKLKREVATSKWSSPKCVPVS